MQGPSQPARRQARRGDLPLGAAMTEASSSSQLMLPTVLTCRNEYFIRAHIYTAIRHLAYSLTVRWT